MNSVNINNRNGSYSKQFKFICLKSIFLTTIDFNKELCICFVLLRSLFSKFKKPICLFYFELCLINTLLNDNSLLFFQFFLSVFLNFLFSTFRFNLFEYLLPLHRRRIKSSDHLQRFALFCYFFDNSQRFEQLKLFILLGIGLLFIWFDLLQDLLICDLLKTIWEFVDINIIPEFIGQFEAGVFITLLELKHDSSLRSFELAVFEGFV